MPDPPLQPHHDAFRRLADSRPLSELDRRLIDAFDRLAGGRSETIDGALTVTNLCAEARVSRASYYRSPVAAVVKTLLASDQTPRPEVEQLRQRVRELDKAGKEQRRRHAQEVGDLKAAAAVYANQVQVLALRNAELEADNRRLVAQLAQVEAAVIPMADRT